MSIGAKDWNLNACIFNREMETQQMFIGRGIQGVCAVPGGSNAGAGDAGVRRGGHLRYGRPQYAASLAVHAAIR